MYTALRSFKVKGDDGQYRLVQPGDPVPEAAGWKNRKSYIERRWICLEGEEPSKAKRYYSAPKAPPAAEPAAEPIAEPIAEPAAEPIAEVDTAVDAVGSYTEKDLKKLNKSELQIVANALDFNPDQSKAELIADILAAQ